MEATNFESYLEEKLQNKEFAERFAKATREWDIALEIQRRREEAGISHQELAAGVGTTQLQISRLERPGYKGSLKTLERVAEALGLQVEIRLIS